jgi:hypothetical protein
MGLAVKKFFHTLPQLPFRFVVDFAKGDGNLPEKLKYAVRSVKFTDAEGNTSEGAIYYGNGSFTIPVWDITARSLSITFEETDDMFVTKFADDIAALSFNSTPLRLAVIVREYDNMMYKILKGRCYWVELLDYDEPQFARTGGPSVVSITMNFIVKAISEDFAVDDEQLKAKLSKVKNSLVGANTVRQDDYSATGRQLLAVADKTRVEKTFDIDYTVPDIGTGRNRVRELTQNGEAARTKNINDIIKRLKDEGVNINDYSDVSDALVRMGIVGASGIHTDGMCQAGNMLLEAIVHQDAKLYSVTPNAAGSVDTWKKLGYKAQETKTFGGDLAALNNQITAAMKSGKLKEGDKIIIDYDGKKGAGEAGHIITVLRNDKGELYTVSDTQSTGRIDSSGNRNGNLTGLGTSHLNSKSTFTFLTK